MAFRGQLASASLGQWLLEPVQWLCQTDSIIYM